MRLENFKRGLFPLVVMAVCATCSPAWGQESGLAQGAERYNVQMPGLARDAEFRRLHQAVETARGMESGGVVPSKVAEVERALAPVLQQLDLYPTLARVHGHEEPEWLGDRGDLTAQAVLALTALQRVSPEPSRAELIKKLATGLVYLQRKERMEYPFGAHISWLDAPPFTQLADGSSVPTAFYRTDHAYAVQALAEAGKQLSEPKFTESALKEALGMSTHLVIHGDLIRSFSPQPELSNNPEDALPLVEGFVSLYKATGNRIYSDIGALATRWQNPRSGFTGPRWTPLLDTLKSSPSAELLSARPVGEPVTFQYIEAEHGRVVNLAIETLDYVSSAGHPGQLAVMGRENTFWMRFDVPTEDDYVFDLSYVQSDVGGGLVSVMMRIDGDKIFKVPLGDVDGKPIFRRAFVDGPRSLRSGPHSFGVRFSGLLMTKPALLDSVVVQPALERREFELPNGQRLYLLRNVTGETARTDRENFPSWPPLESLVVNQEGQESKLGTAEDRRRRKTYVTLPPYGVALVRLNAPRME